MLAPTRGVCALQSARREEFLAGKRQIEEQMLEKERRRFLEGEEAARVEREAVDALIRKVQEEERRDREERARARDDAKVCLIEMGAGQGIGVSESVVTRGCNCHGFHSLRR